MELLSRNFVKYFYILLIWSILFHLADAIIAMFSGACKIPLFAVILLSIVNVMLLVSNIRFNVKQQFEECKVGAKALRITIIPLLVFDTLCIWEDFGLLLVRDNILALLAIELVLWYRIRCIEYLEKMANQLRKHDN